VIIPMKTMMKVTVTGKHLVVSGDRIAHSHSSSVNPIDSRSQLAGVLCSRRTNARIREEDDQFAGGSIDPPLFSIFLFIGCNMKQYKSWPWVPGSPALPLMVPCHPAHDVHTVHELKTRAHAVTACAPCDMLSGGAGHAPPQPRLS
jgi:hypothetical protein